MISVISGPRVPKELIEGARAPRSGSQGSPECLKISFEFVLTRSTAEGVGGALGPYTSISESEAPFLGRALQKQKI